MKCLSVKVKFTERVHCLVFALSLLTQNNQTYFEAFSTHFLTLSQGQVKPMSQILQKGKALGSSVVLWWEHGFERSTFRFYPWFYHWSYLWLWMCHLPSRNPDLCTQGNRWHAQQTCVKNKGDKRCELLVNSWGASDVQSLYPQGYQR